MPWALLERSIREKQPYEVFQLRGMIAVPYFEKAGFNRTQGEVCHHNGQSKPSTSTLRGAVSVFDKLKLCARLSSTESGKPRHSNMYVTLLP